MKPSFATTLAVSILICWFAAGPVPAEKPGNDLRVTKVYLGFKNQQRQRTVQRRQRALQAFVDIDYTGAGMFEGCWMVDGKFFADIAQYVTGVGTVRIASPETPGLPTILEGLHIVTLVVKNPVQPFKPVRISYFVTPATESVGPFISLINPPDSAVVDLAGQAFTWESDTPMKTYLIEFIDDDPARPVASAFTEELYYKVPPPVAKYRFTPGRTYFWRIKSFSASHELVSESHPRQFQMIGGNAYDAE